MKEIAQFKMGKKLAKRICMYKLNKLPKVPKKQNNEEEKEDGLANGYMNN